MSIRTPRCLLAFFSLWIPVIASAQWIEPNSTTIRSNCSATPAPCTVEINPGNTTNMTAVSAGGDIIATGSSIDVGASSTSGPGAIWANAPTGSTSHVLLRSGGAEAVHLRREATSNDFTIWTNNTERFRIMATGNLGIGTPNALYKLDVNGTARATAFHVNSVNSNPPVDGFQFNAETDVFQRSAGVRLRSKYNGTNTTSFIANLGTYGTFISHNREPQYGGFVDTAATTLPGNAAHAIVGDAYFGRLFALGSFEGTAAAPDTKTRFVMLYNGNVGIGSSSTANNPTERLVVDGNIHVTGNINAKYQDVAEWVPSNDDLTPGTVVVLDPAIGNGVMESAAAYDTSVAGVVSAQPGIILGEAGAGKEQIATTGRVRMRVDATSAPIHVGDLLDTSDKAGCAMKSIPVEVAGIAMHRPGTIVGKALEPLASGKGEILVLLSLQ